jgi:hypothetical protein
VTVRSVHPHGCGEATGDVPDRLTLGATLVLVTVALGLAFGVQVLVGAGASAAKPTAKPGPALVQSTPGSALDLGLTAARAVPALRVSSKDRVHAGRPTRTARRSVTPALTLVSAPVSPATSARPAPTAVPAPPPRVIPAPTPKPEPTPASTPESSGDFDTTGEPGTTVTQPVAHTSRTRGAAKE